MLGLAKQACSLGAGAEVDILLTVVFSPLKKKQQILGFQANE